MTQRRFHIAFLLLWISASPSAWAQAGTVDIKSNLQNTMNALSSAQKEQHEIEHRNKALQSELDSLQQDLVGLVAMIQARERVLSDLETKFVQLRKEEKLTSSDLKELQENLSQMLMGMAKLSYVPPQLVVAMPGDFAHTLRTAKVLGLTSTALSQEAKVLSTKLEEMQRLEKLIRENHAMISEQKAALEEGHRTLESKLSERSTLQSSLIDKKELNTRELAALSSQSADLKELLSKIETSRKERRAEQDKPAVIPQLKPESPQETSSAPTSGGNQGRSFADAQGKISLPAEGKISSFYGDATDNGDPSRGITIKTRDKAQVTSPFDGEVVYTGPFLEYGNLVIIRHSDDYHTLLAGMERITSKPGQHVLKGEPVGEMGQSDKGTKLYMEVRKESRPVDPSPWFGSNRVANRKSTH